jgi:hypothetical protein
MKLAISIFLIALTLGFALSLQEVDQKYLVAQDKGDPALLESCVQDYLQLAKINPNNSEVMWKTARAYIEYGLRTKDDNKKVDIFKKAREFGEKATKINKNSAMGHYETAVAIGRLAQYVGILKSLFNLPALDGNFNDAIRLDPKLARAYLGLGMRYRDTPWYVGGSFSKALSYINKAIEIDPNYLNNYLELGTLYEKMGKKKEAISAFEKVISMKSYFPYTYQFTEAKNQAKEELKNLEK